MEVTSLPRAAGTVRLSPRLLAPLSDNRLVDQIRRGNEAAFEVVYDRHHRGLLSFCRHMLGSPDEAEDAVQQTFTSAYRDLTGSGKPIRLKPWLYTIARNRCLSMLRVRREEATELSDIPTAGLSDAVVERDEVRRLLADVRRLPEDQRAALVLSELGDLSHAEIAEIVGCEAVQVKALVFQARSSLIASKEAADVPCHEIREQIATARGAALRRGILRRHMRACAACAEYRDQVRRQRQMLALALPVIPSAALKNSVLTAVGVGHAAAGGGAAGGALAGCTGASGSVAAGGTAAGGGVGIAAGVGGAGGGGVLASIGALGGAKLAVIAAVAAGVAGGGLAIEEQATSSHRDSATAAGLARGSSGTPRGTAFGGIPRAFGAKVAPGLMFPAQAGGSSANGARASAGANSHGGNAGGNGNENGNGRGKGKGHGNGNANGPNKGTPYQPLELQNGSGTTSGTTDSSAPSSTSNGNAYGNGGTYGGNGNAYGNTGSAPQPNGNAYGRSGSSGSATSPPPADGGHGRHLGNGGI